MNPIQQLQQRIGTNPDGDVGRMTLKAFRDHFKISNEMTAHFFGQCAHETGGFILWEENLNYSADGLLRVFPKYFDKKTALMYQRKPILIASRVYANRMGNGSEASQDGWKFRGRGALQTTGKDNYHSLALNLNDSNIIDNPEHVAGMYAFDSALFYFKRNNLWRLCTEINDVTIGKLTKAINGGFNGLEDRKKRTLYYYDLLRK